ncbi:extensin family protein [Tsuneonella dongtanensis]|uniref:extensin-like domain-containing protein n=1 Tax=Tsuneonella dongtanensis TaxID=692370 RepID=UPI001E648FF5|nr:extensin family protein [Tsuneonella dongtanensis]
MKRLRGARLSRIDHLAFSALLLAALVLAAKGWLDAHPQHNPWAPLDLRDPPGWATQAKIAAMRSDAAICRGVLERSEIAFETLDPAGEGACARTDRTLLSQAPLRPNVPPTTCAVAAGVEIWLRDAVRPAAQEELGAPLASIEHYGAYSCRRMYSRDDAPWSEHATGNAIDVAAFVLEDGRRITVLRDWDGDDAEARFLRRVRDGACGPFGTVLGPEYNAAHRDHFHFDQAARGLGGVCR